MTTVTSIRELETPLEKSMPGALARVYLPDSPIYWSTPGLALTSGVFDLKEVRFVLERVEPDRYTVFVILEDDPEIVLDRIFGAEHELYDRFARMPFDVRVMKPAPSWTPGGLLRETVLRYARP
jgi:hypothetical protein